MTRTLTRSAIPVIDNQTRSVNVSRMPAWIRHRLGSDRAFTATLQTVRVQKLHTICEEARCPNRGECWSRGTATFMLLGDTCTRACGFCSVKTGRPAQVDKNEPQRVAEAVSAMGLRYVVLTSVNRDDLQDGGAGIFADTLKALRKQDKKIGVEFLTPDFYRCQKQAIGKVYDVLNQLNTGNTGLIWGHNVETVPRLYRKVRKGANYQRSLELLTEASAIPGVESKSAIMLGLGETHVEIYQVLRDLRDAGVKRISIGQYLRPTMEHLPVKSYIHPHTFSHYALAARTMGFSWVKSGPLVRSSYHAEENQSSEIQEFNQNQFNKSQAKEKCH